MSSRNLEAVRLLLRPFLGQIDDFRTLKFHMHKYLPFPIAHCAVQHWFWLLNRLLISQATAFTDVASETNLSFERTCLEEDLEEILSHCSQQCRKFQHVTSQHVLYVCGLCVSGHQAMGQMVLMGDAKQDMSEEKSGLVETWITWSAATALCKARNSVFLTVLSKHLHSTVVALRLSH